MQRLDNLQGLRAIAFVLIFLSHCGIGDLARWAVTLFFVLSGFLMVYNYYSRDNIACSIKQNILFSYKKINKLFPLHLIMLLPVLALTLYSALKGGTLGFDFIINQSLVLLSNVFLVQSWIPVRAFYFGYNGVAWFLSVCALLYFVFPFVLKNLKKKASRKKAIFVMTGCFALQCVFSVFVNVVNCEWITAHKDYLVYIFPLYRVLDFVIGCNLGYLFLNCNHSKDDSKVKFTVFELLAILTSIVTSAALGFAGWGDVLYSAKDLPGIVLMIFVFAFNRGFVSKLLSVNMFVWIGNLSAYTFLIHQVVINLLQIVAGNKYIVALVAFVITLVGAVVYERVDKAIRKRRV
ncbi:MAG: acyltransferase [Ruminococcus sp.]|nr:acyltransferase [Ruminococcus sp.]